MKNYHQAALDTVTEITSTNGTLVEQYRYDVYGEPTILSTNNTPLSTSAIGNRLMFQGRDRDPDTGLYNFRYRYYSPTLGRFVQVDPIRVRGGINFYRFVNNRPVQTTDPFGLQEFWHDPTYEHAMDCGLRIKNEVWAEYGTGEPKHAPKDDSCREAHCIAHCRITRECVGGGLTSFLGGVAKEGLDQLEKWLKNDGDGWDSDDMAANKKGRDAARQCPDKSCEDLCKGAR